MVLSIFLGWTENRPDLPEGNAAMEDDVLLLGRAALNSQFALWVV